MKFRLYRTASVCDADSGRQGVQKNQDKPDSTHNFPIKHLMYHRGLRISPLSKRLIPPAVWFNCHGIIILFLLSSTRGWARETLWSTLDLLWLFSGGTARLDSSPPVLCKCWSTASLEAAPPTGWFSPEWCHKGFDSKVSCVGLRFLSCVSTLSFLLVLNCWLTT